MSDRPALAYVTPRRARTRSSGVTEWDIVDRQKWDIYIRHRHRSSQVRGTALVGEALRRRQRACTAGDDGAPKEPYNTPAGPHAPRCPGSSKRSHLAALARSSAFQASPKAWREHTRAAL